MTEGEKHCGLASLLPMSCRGRAEAFARRLHNRLRSLGSQDSPDGSTASEHTWIASDTSPSVTLQPRNPPTDIFVDFNVFESPGSPQEEISEPELTKYITNPKDDLHHLNLDECNCIVDKVTKRNSLDSDSSDGAYYDPENLEIPNFILSNPITNGIDHQIEEQLEDDDEIEEESLADSKDCNKNNNIYHAIDLESLKINQEELIPKDNESYYSHLNIQQDLTIECPNPIVEVSTLEIPKTDEEEVSESKVDTNHLQVKSLIDDEEEERVPRVRRCSSLKTGKTPPGTPGRKKIVRFADVLGLDLADVRTYMDEIPKVPISAFDDLSLSETSLSSSSALESLHSPSKTLVPLFQQPGGEANFMEKIRTNQVCLENAILNDSTTLSVCGTVRVRNLDFHKSVHIRYSIDSWKSFADLQATYLDKSCDGFSDKFSFTLYVHTLNIGQRLEFAVRFQCKGCQYWDNNEGQNYCFQCLPACTNTYTPITNGDEVTWGAAFY